MAIFICILPHCLKRKKNQHLILIQNHQNFIKHRWLGLTLPHSQEFDSVGLGRSKVLNF